MSKIKRWPIIIVLLIFIDSIVAETEDDMSHESLVKLVLDYRNSYGAYNVFIARSEPSSDIHDTLALITLLKQFSKQNVYAMITRITDIPKNISFNFRRTDRSLFIVILRSKSDYDDFVNVTKTNNMNLYQLLVIFTKETKFCHNPEGNPFNLVFDSRVLVKCPFSATIREWYSLRPNKTKMINFLKWTPHVRSFKRLTNMSFYERRNSLEGITLRVTTMKDSVAENQTNLIGFFGNVLNELSKVAHFKIELQPFESSPGSFDPKRNTYSGIMGKLYERKTDIGLGEFTITQERMEMVDFCDPIYISNTNFYVKNSHASYLLWSMYYKPFGLRACLIIFAIYIVSPLLLTIIKPRSSSNLFLTIYDNYFTVWGMLCIKSPIDLPKQTPARIAHFSLYILSFMLYSIYSALLVSYLTIFKPDMPFNSLDDFFAAKTHKLITITNTSFIDTFKFSNDQQIRRLSSFLLPEKNLPTSLSEAIDLVCLQNKDIALYIDEMILQSTRFDIPCELMPFERGRLSSMGLAFVKHSPYVGLINYHLQRMRNFGVLNAIKEQNLEMLVPREMTYKQVHLWSTLPLYGILGCGAAIAIIIFILEKIVFCSYHQQHHTRDNISTDNKIKGFRSLTFR